MTCSAAVSTPSSRASIETPSQTVSNLLHLVTQWMSLVTVSRGSLRNSSQVQRFGSSTSPVIENAHSLSAVRGVGPADRMGKSRTWYWPGGRRPSWDLSRSRPTKPQKKKLTVRPPPKEKALAVAVLLKEDSSSPSTSERTSEVLYPRASSLGPSAA